MKSHSDGRHTNPDSDKLILARKAALLSSMLFVVAFALSQPAYKLREIFFVFYWDSDYGLIPLVYTVVLGIFFVGFFFALQGFKFGVSGVFLSSAIIENTIFMKISVPIIARLVGTKIEFISLEHLFWCAWLLGTSFLIKSCYLDRKNLSVTIGSNFVSAVVLAVVIVLSIK